MRELCCAGRDWSQPTWGGLANLQYRRTAHLRPQAGKQRMTYTLRFLLVGPCDSDATCTGTFVLAGALLSDQLAGCVNGG